MIRPISKNEHDQSVLACRASYNLQKLPVDYVIYLTQIIHAAWSCGFVPSFSTYYFTIRSTQSFHIVSSQQYLAENKSVEERFPERHPKRFHAKLSGKLEHTAHTAHVINNARTKQRSLIILLLDLDVHECHPIPDHITILSVAPTTTSKPQP